MGKKNGLLKVFAEEDGPRKLTGERRWKVGDRLTLEVGYWGTVFVFGGWDVSPFAVGHGTGLLYTYNADEWRVEVDGKVVSIPKERRR